MTKYKAFIPKNDCIACGSCKEECPIDTISIFKGMFAIVGDKCIGCRRCSKVCPISIIQFKEVKENEEK